MRLRYMADKSDVSIFLKKYNAALDNVLPEMRFSDNWILWYIQKQ